MVTTLGLILLGSGFFGSGPLPIASAENDDSHDDSHDDSNNDKSEKFKKT